MKQERMILSERQVDEGRVREQGPQALSALSTFLNCSKHPPSSLSQKAQPWKMQR